MAIIVRDSGNESKFRFTVIIKTAIEELFYSIPKDTNTNYRFLGSNEDGFHDGSIFGEVIDLSELPASWQAVVIDLERDALNFANQKSSA